MAIAAASGATSAGADVSTFLIRGWGLIRLSSTLLLGGGEVRLPGCGLGLLCGDCSAPKLALPLPAWQTVGRELTMCSLLLVGVREGLAMTLQLPLWARVALDESAVLIPSFVRRSHSSDQKGLSVSGSQSPWPSPALPDFLLLISAVMKSAAAAALSATTAAIFLHSAKFVR